MRISFKSTITLFVLLFFIGSSLIFVKLNQENFIKSTFAERSNNQKQLFDKIFELYEKRLQALSIDYTYWDELVNFVKTGDKEFASDNLDTGLDTYEASVIWVYNTENKLVYSVADKEGQFVKGEEFPLNPLERDSLFERNRLVHFFVKTNEGVFDVFGATIHPSNDSERKTTPQVYFFTASLLNSPLLSEICNITSSKVSLESVPNKSSLVDQVDPRQGKLIFYKDLVGFDDKVVAQFKIDNKFKGIKDFSTASDRDFLIFFALGVGFLILVFLVIYLQNRSVENAMRIAEVMTANLTESEARFRAMNDASPFGIFVTDPKGKCIYTNVAYQKISGQSSEESWGDGWIEIVHPDDRERVYMQWYQSASAGGDFSSEHRLKLKSGSEVWVVVKADGIRVEDKLLGYIGVVEDVTEEKKHQEDIEARNRDLERMNKSMVNRELKMAELKKEIARLKKGQK